MNQTLPDLKSKIEENLKELRYSDNITELLCVLENPLGGQTQVHLTLVKADDEDEYQETIDVQPNTPIIKINGGKIL